MSILAGSPNQIVFHTPVCYTDYDDPNCLTTLTPPLLSFKPFSALPVFKMGYFVKTLDIMLNMSLRLVKSKPCQVKWFYLCAPRNHIQSL